ncbi:TlpA family protein disulfide reductase [Chloroflexota bacterium]
MRKLIVIMLAMVMVLTVFLAGCESTGASIGEKAPGFQLNSLSGESVSLSDFHGKTVLINFWTTWCGYCRVEMPYLQEISAEWLDRGLVVLAIDVGESASRVEDFMRTNNLSLTVLLDTRETVFEQYSVVGLPTTFFIDKDGIIRARVVGAFPDKYSIENYLNEIIP